MADLLASIFGGGKQTAPVLPTYDPAQAQKHFLGQDFGGAQSVSNNFTKNTSQTNLSTNLAGLAQVDPNAINGINLQQNLGNSLLSGSMDGLPNWAKTYLNNGKTQAAESAIGRGVGAFSDNAASGTNQYLGNNALNLVNFGSQLASGASAQSQNLVNANMYRADPTLGISTPGQFQQAGEFNTGILGQNAINQTAAQNWNNSNSPWGSAIRTGLQDLTYIAGQAAGSAGKMA